MHARLNSYKRATRANEAARWAAALASITEAVTDSSEDANRLPRRIAQAVAAGLGGSPVVSLALSGSNGPRAVLARTAGGRTRSFKLPEERTPGPTVPDASAGLAAGRALHDRGASSHPGQPAPAGGGAPGGARGGIAGDGAAAA